MTQKANHTEHVKILNNKAVHCAVERKPRDAAAALLSLKFVDVIYYKFNISQASKSQAPEL